MSDDYVAEISIPINYSNVPADKQLNNKGDELSVRLRANGGDLVSIKYFSGFGDLDINLNQADLRLSRYFDRYYILTELVRSEISSRFEFEHDLISLSPDTIYLDLEDIVSRSLPVQADISLDFKPQYMLYDSIVISPASIMVSGPASHIDTLTCIYTERQSFSALDMDKEFNILIQPPVKSDEIRYSESSVKVFIPVQQFTESSIELPVTGISNDTGIESIRTFPETVQLTYQVALKDYQLVKSEMFSLQALYNPGKDIEKTFLKVRVDKSPDFVRITRIQPDKVEFIIQN